MSAETCGAEHPEESGTVCDRKPHHNTGFHKDSRRGTIWAADPSPEVAGSGRDALAAIAARATRHHPTGPAGGAANARREQGGR